MSDADNQTGGTGGDAGTEPGRVTPGKDNAAPVDPDSPPQQRREDDDESDDSFPASDPPGNY